MEMIDHEMGYSAFLRQDNWTFDVELNVRAGVDSPLDSNYTISVQVRTSSVKRTALSHARSCSRVVGLRLELFVFLREGLPLRFYNNGLFACFQLVWSKWPGSARRWVTSVIQKPPNECSRSDYAPPSREALRVKQRFARQVKRYRLSFLFVRGSWCELLMWPFGFALRQEGRAAEPATGCEMFLKLGPLGSCVGHVGAAGDPIPLFYARCF
uniref:Uncharacterized protein n=1 Tax=Anopheles atroparvus TaxID=41427 RepID=A0AAG5DR14_ANOAO